MGPVNLLKPGTAQALPWRLSLTLFFALTVLPGAPPEAGLSRGARAAEIQTGGPAVPLAETLTSPPVLRNASEKPGVVDLDLTAAPSRLEFVHGKPTTAWAYNGMVPGPTIELREGDTVTIHFHNKLAQTTTVHWHGLHIPATADGSPLNPVKPGQSQDYVFKVPLGTAGTYWYHPHPDMTTTEQVAKGLYGALVCATCGGSSRRHPRPAPAPVGQPVPGGRVGGSSGPHVARGARR